jgi:hypothetical protein
MPLIQRDGDQHLAAESRSARAQGALATFPQGVMLESYLFQKACLEGPR